jgi:hypothetical protein
LIHATQKEGWLGRLLGGDRGATIPGNLKTGHPKIFQISARDSYGIYLTEYLCIWLAF